MMDDGYTDCEVEVFGLMRKGENVGDADGMGLVLARDGDEVCRSGEEEDSPYQPVY